MVGELKGGYFDHHVKKVSVNIMSFNIDVGNVVNDYHYLRGEGGEALIKELHDSDVGCACSDCNRSTILCIT